MLKIIIGDNHSNKDDLLGKEIKTALNQSRDVYLIVAKQFTFETERKFYELLGATEYNKIKVLSFNRLAEHVFLFSGEKPNYIDDVKKSILLFTAVKNCYESILYFGKNSLKTSFIESLSILISELIQAGISPEKLMSNIAMQSPNLQEKLVDISLIYTEYLKLLNCKNLKDNMTAITEAAHLANKTNFFHNSFVCLDEFDTLTADQLEFFDSMLSTDIVVSLSSKENNKFFRNIYNLYSNIYVRAQEKNIKIEEIIAKKSQRASDLEYISECLTSLSPKGFTNKSKCVEIIEANDYYQEAEYICAEIKHLDVNYSDIVIITRHIETYKNIFSEMFKRYEIPCFIDIKQNTSHTAIVLLVTTLLAILSAKKLDTDAIMRYAKNELLAMPIEDINLLEDYCFKWDIDGDSWLRAFNSPETEEIRLNLIEPILALKIACDGKNVNIICKEMFLYLEKIELEENINNLYKQLDIKNARELIQTYNYFIEYLDTFVDLIGDKVLKLPEFVEIFTKTIHSITYSAPPQIVNGVKMLDASRTRLCPAKVVFVIGVNEDLFPSSASDRGILFQKEKTVLSKKGLDFGRNLKDKNSDELLFFYKSVTNANEKLYISYSLSNTTNQKLSSDNQLLKLKENMPNLQFLRCSDFSAEHYCITPAAAYHYYVSHYSEQISEIKEALSELHFYQNRIENIEKFSKLVNHNITDKKLLKDLFTDKISISPTSFETVIKCPFKFFCEYGLKIKERTKVELNPLSRGNFIHYCLEKIFKDYQKSFLTLSREKIDDYIEEKAKEYLEKEYGNSDIINERFKANFKIISDSIVDLVREIQEQLKNSEFTPKEFEITLDKNRKNKPFKVKTEDFEVEINGKIDRIDVFDHYIRVVDYKSGKKDADPKMLAYGLDFQLFFYLFAITETGSEYVDSTPQGVMYMPAGVIDNFLDRSILPTKNDVEKLKSDHYALTGFTIGEKYDYKANALSYLAFENLKDFSKEKVEKTIKKLYDGDVDATPLTYGKSPCEYCNYKDTCGNFPNKKEQEKFSRADVVIKKILEGKN
ncbi:ATP-dependent helicase/deoxyribonuclease subunit B [Clostridia bacterium]|nr:ATP-dependent helicase/deoxyribonuclease subunit B [Clostridia bacterium]